MLDATVGAIITRPLTESNSQDLVDQTVLFLSDNGLDPDVTANDGVYSGYFVDFTASGRYNVKVDKFYRLHSVGSNLCRTCVIVCFYIMLCSSVLSSCCRATDLFK